MAQAYQAKDFSRLIGMEGFSEKLLKTHFGLYEGYVNNTNKLLGLLADKPKDGMNPEYAELRRRLGFEFNGMRLHEYYFGNLGGNGQLPSGGALSKAINQDFGSYEKWEEDFKATGRMRGVGWSILYYDNAAGRLINEWIAEHENGHFSGCTPVLVMDVWEHAFMLDYGTDRGSYIGAFFKNVDWGKAEARLSGAGAATAVA